MPTRLNPYLSFGDNAREAMQFYQAVFGGELSLSTFGETPAGTDPSDQNKIMHALLETENGLTLMGADTPTGMQHTPGGSVSCSLSGDDDGQLRRYWDGLSEGASIAVPLTTAPWGDTFGMLTDRFGVTWLVNIAGGSPQ